MKNKRTPKNIGHQTIKRNSSLTRLGATYNKDGIVTTLATLNEGYHESIDKNNNGKPLSGVSVFQWKNKFHIGRNFYGFSIEGGKPFDFNNEGARKNSIKVLKNYLNNERALEGDNFTIVYNGSAEHVSIGKLKSTLTGYYNSNTRYRIYFEKLINIIDASQNHFSSLD